MSTDIQKTPASQIKKREKRKRRRIVSTLLLSGYSDDEIIEIVSRETNPNGTAGLKMTGDEFRKLQREVYAKWTDEDSRRDPYLKSAAKRRIKEHIRKAASADSWAAVSNFEKVLAGIEGTNEPLEVTMPTENRVNEALLVILSQKDPAELRELIDKERERYQGERQLPAPSTTVTIDIQPDASE